MQIDAHCDFRDPEQGDHGWLDPGPPALPLALDPREGAAIRGDNAITFYGLERDSR